MLERGRGNWDLSPLEKFRSDPPLKETGSLQIKQLEKAFLGVSCLWKMGAGLQ